MFPTEVINSVVLYALQMEVLYAIKEFRKDTTYCLL